MDSKKLYENIGDNIKVYRKRLGISQAELASKLDLKRASICNYEKGLQKVSIDNLADMCELFNCSLSVMVAEKRRYLRV